MNTALYMRAEVAVWAVPGGAVVSLRRATKAWGNNGKNWFRAERLMGALNDALCTDLVRSGHQISVTN